MRESGAKAIASPRHGLPRNVCRVVRFPIFKLRHENYRVRLPARGELLILLVLGCLPDS